MVQVHYKNGDKETIDKDYFQRVIMSTGLRQEVFTYRYIK